MNSVNRILDSYDYLTPELAVKHGISKFKFYKYLKDNNLEQVSRGIYISKDVQKLFFHMMKHFIFMD